MAPRPRIDPADSPKREAILAAALDLFADRGFHGTTMPEIADRARVGAGTLYRYFETKETLVNELFRHWKARFAGDVVSRELSKDSEELFGQLWRGMWDFYKKHPKVVRFLELHHHAPYLDEESRRVEERILAPLRTFVETAKRNGEIKPVSTPLLIALVHGAFLGLLHAEARGQVKITNETLGAAELSLWTMLSRA
jgi:AcrR family transcriptional regulator